LRALCRSQKTGKDQKQSDMEEALHYSTELRVELVIWTVAPYTHTYAQANMSYILRTKAYKRGCRTKKKCSSGLGF
jgi:hypothetical protein